MSAVKWRLARALLTALITAWLAAEGNDDLTPSASEWVAALLSRALQVATLSGASAVRGRLRSRSRPAERPTRPAPPCR